MKKHKKSGLINFLIKIGMVLLVTLSIGGVAISLNYRDVSNWVTRIAGKQTRKDERPLKVNFRKEGQNQISAKIASKLAYGGTKDDLTSPKKIWQYAHDTSYPLGYVGRIAIPSRNINLPINNGSTNRVLAVGAGTLKDSFAPKPYNEADVMGKSNFAICGHNMDDHYTLFSAIPDMTNGEHIYTYNGHQIFVYEKTSTQVISPNNISVIFNTKETDRAPIITMTTCTYDGSARYAVRGRLVKTYANKMKAPKNVKKLFFYQK